MKRSSLTRKKPMSRGSWKSSPSGSTLKQRAAIKSRVKSKTKAEREHLDAVCRLGCIVCRNLGHGETPCEIHHVRFKVGGAQRASHFDVLGLCPNHHRLGGHGIAYHSGPETWEANYGTEQELLEQTRRETGIVTEELEVV